MLTGNGTLQVQLAGTEVEVGPLGFLQPNPRVAELAYRDLVAAPSGAALGGELAYDLYAGAGITTALLAVADPIKETAREAIEAVRRSGLRIVVLTGDGRATDGRPFCGSASRDR